MKDSSDQALEAARRGLALDRQRIEEETRLEREQYEKRRTTRPGLRPPGDSWPNRILEGVCALCVVALTLVPIGFGIGALVTGGSFLQDLAMVSVGIGGGILIAIALFAGTLAALNVVRVLLNRLFKALRETE